MNNTKQQSNMMKAINSLFDRSQKGELANLDLNIIRGFMVDNPEIVFSPFFENIYTDNGVWLLCNSNIEGYEDDAFTLCPHCGAWECITEKYVKGDTPINMLTTLLKIPDPSTVAHYVLGKATEAGLEL